MPNKTASHLHYDTIQATARSSSFFLTDHSRLADHARPCLGRGRKGLVLRVVGGGVPYLPCRGEDAYPSPPPNRITHTCESITFPPITYVVGNKMRLFYQAPLHFRLKFGWDWQLYVRWVMVVECLLLSAQETLHTPGQVGK